MVFAQIFGAAKFTAETIKGAALVAANPNAPVQAVEIHPRQPARPYTLPEFIRGWSWRYTWRYVPVFRFWVLSAVSVAGFVAFIAPIQPRTMVKYWKGKEESHHHHIQEQYGRDQKREDALYFKKHNPLKKEGEPDVSGHH